MKATKLKAGSVQHQRCTTSTLSRSKLAVRPCASIKALEQNHVTRITQKLPPTVNWHLEPRCNYSCSFCFATFKDIGEQDVVRDLDKLRQIPRLLRLGGADKLTFVGGEPLMHPHIDQLITEAKAAGLTTALVTNGACLNAERLLRLKGKLDWITFSVDASQDELHAAMGRGMRKEVTHGSERHGSHHAANAATGNNTNSTGHAGSSTSTSISTVSSTVGGARNAPGASSAASSNRHLARVRTLWPLAVELGFRLKLNTVVCSVNAHDDMTALIGELRPERWKVFQVLPVAGQNAGSVEPLLISSQQFQEYCTRHAAVKERYGVELVIESNDLMAASYVMLDGRACFYQDMGPPHGYMYGPSIFSMLSSADASEAHANSVESTSSTNSSSSSIVTNFDTNDIVPFANEPQQLTAAVESALLSSDQHAKVDGYGGEGANAWADGNASNARERAAVMAAWEPVAHAFQSQRFAARGAVYEWGQGDGMLSQQLQEWAQQV